MGLYWMEPVGAWCRISSGPIMLLLIPSRHTTLSTLIFCLIRSQKANSYPSGISPVRALWRSLTRRSNAVLQGEPDQGTCAAGGPMIQKRL